MAAAQEEKIRQQLELLVESHEKRLWKLYVPVIFVLIVVIVSARIARDRDRGIIDMPLPSQATLKVLGVGLLGYVVFSVATLIQRKIETNHAVARFNQHFPPGAPERAIALQLLALNSGPGAKRLFAKLGGASQLVSDSVTGQEVVSATEAPAFQPIPIEADTAPGKTPTAFAQSGPPNANKGYIPLQPDVQDSEASDDECRPR